ncbi:MAG: fumarylacetoacetate hydrolase family protein [Bacteroidetes bacterium]|nr:fumarylacetoacetate hydrolase family protein [Bacteroidota bacterium]
MKIICIGRNYRKHAIELNHPIPTEPVFFLKPETALVLRNRPFFYPDFSTKLHHEIEVVLRVCKVGKHIQEKFAHTYYDAIALGIDFTARDVQEACIKKGEPWEKAKSFDGSAPLSPFIPKEEFDDVSNVSFSLKRNGEIVQTGNTSDLIFSFSRIISYVSQYITLKKGDYIFTGTPSGVGPVQIGDRLEAFLGEKKMMYCNVR